MRYAKIIQTKYLGPSNCRGSRVTAFDSNKNRVTIFWRSELGVEDNHKAAADALLQKINDKHSEKALWRFLSCGSLESGYVFSVERKLTRRSK